jgi:GT2 family glycosyltransferase
VIPEQEGPPPPSLLVSVVITTYNRRDALALTIDALGRQLLDHEQYEVVVVDDGSTDDTWGWLSAAAFPCRVRAIRQNANAGISAGRNLAVRHAAGQYLVFVSDDLIVPPEFLTTHLNTLCRHPGTWVVGGISQLPTILDSPFGRYLDWLERSWEGARKVRPLEPDLWEISWPTARNLSLPRADFDSLGGFDEQFRMSCEDQDLAHKARALGVRYLYNAAITCLHNDQVGDLTRFCQAQVPRTRDTVLFCHRWSTDHADAPVARLNGYMSRADSPVLLARKLVKAVMAFGPVTRLLEVAVRTAERVRLPDRVLWRMYRVLIGVYMFRGWREGLRLVQRSTAGLPALRAGQSSRRSFRGWAG